MLNTLPRLGILLSRLNTSCLNWSPFCVGGYGPELFSFFRITNCKFALCEKLERMKRNGMKCWGASCESIPSLWCKQRMQLSQRYTLALVIPCCFLFDLLDVLNRRPSVVSFPELDQAKNSASNIPYLLWVVNHKKGKWKRKRERFNCFHSYPILCVKVAVSNEFNCKTSTRNLRTN